MKYINKKVGTIEVTEEIYKEFWSNVNLQIIPYRVEYRAINRSFMIDCSCSLFRELKKDDFIPKYVLIFKTIMCNPFKNKGRLSKIIIDGVEEV